MFLNRKIAICDICYLGTTLHIYTKYSISGRYFAICDLCFSVCSKHYWKYCHWKY